MLLRLAFSSDPPEFRREASFGNSGGQRMRNAGVQLVIDLLARPGLAGGCSFLMECTENPCAFNAFLQR